MSHKTRHPKRSIHNIPDSSEAADDTRSDNMNQLSTYRRLTREATEEGMSLSEDLPYFVVPDFGELRCLTPEEERHAIRVLRLGNGEEIRITDGGGHLYRAYLTAQGHTALLHDVEELPIVASPIPDLHIAISPTKNMDRIEIVTEKLTEVGLTSLTLVITDRAIRRQAKIERLEKVMLGAMKQSRKVCCTTISVCSSMDEYLSQLEEPTHAFVGYCGDEFERNEMSKCFRPGKATHLLIGPEGDFTPEEVSAAVSAGFVPVTLGQERLRTETAAIYGGMLHHILNSHAL